MPVDRRRLSREPLRWGLPALVIAFAAILRFWALGRPDTLVFDELYYVRDAISQLAHGFPTTWPTDDADLAATGSNAYTDDPANAVHPPLGKWIIGLGIWMFGPDSGWGWRSSVAFAGVVTVALVMRLGWLVSRSRVIAYMAGLFLAVDGVHVVLSRVALLDGILTSVIMLGALCIWRDVESTPRPEARGLRARFPVLWHRPWLIAAAALFGAAAAVKWSGLYPLAAFLIFVTVRDLVIRLRTRERHAAWRASLQALATAALALPTALAVYLLSWVGWIATSGGWSRASGSNWVASLANYHAEMLGWHSTLSAPHPYAAHPITWPFALRPTAMYEARWTESCPWAECVSGISALPNPLITWGGALALMVLTALVLRRTFGLQFGRPTAPLVAAGSFVIVGYLSGWLPWIFTPARSAVFQFYAVVLTPFSALALALVCGLLCGIPVAARTGLSGGLGPRVDNGPEAVRGRSVAVAMFIALSVILAVLFAPVWIGAPVADWFWQAHMWLPGWS